MSSTNLNKLNLSAIKTLPTNNRNELDISSELDLTPIPMSETQRILEESLTLFPMSEAQRILEESLDLMNRSRFELEKMIDELPSFSVIKKSDQTSISFEPSIDEKKKRLQELLENSLYSVKSIESAGKHMLNESYDINDDNGTLLPEFVHDEWSDKWLKVFASEVCKVYRELDKKTRRPVMACAARAGLRKKDMEHMMKIKITSNEWADIRKHARSHLGMK